MYTTYLIVALVTVVANAGIALADFARAPFVLANSAEVGVPPGWVPWLGTLELAGATGVLLGLATLERSCALTAAAGSRGQEYL